MLNTLRPFNGTIEVDNKTLNISGLVSAKAEKLTFQERLERVMNGHSPNVMKYTLSNISIR